MISHTISHKFFIKHTCVEHCAILQQQLLELSKSGYLSVKKFVEEHADEYEISPGWEAELNKHYCLEEVAKKLYPMDGQKVLVPVTSSADGNCLFNSMPILLVGNESLNTELRMKTARECITNRHLYDKLEYLKYITIKKEQFEEEVLDTIKDGSYPGIMQIKALAAVTKRHINSIYPMVENSIVDRSFFHRYITPSTNEESSSTEEVGVFNIMWTHTGNKALKGWHPNHFVACFSIKDLSKLVGRTSNKRKCKREKEVKEDLKIMSKMEATKKHIKCTCRSSNKKGSITNIFTKSSKKSVDQPNLENKGDFNVASISNERTNKIRSTKKLKKSRSITDLRNRESQSYNFFFSEVVDKEMTFYSACHP